MRIFWAALAAVCAVGVGCGASGRDQEATLTIAKAGKGSGGKGGSGAAGGAASPGDGGTGGSGSQAAGRTGSGGSSTGEAGEPGTTGGSGGETDPGTGGSLEMGGAGGEQAAGAPPMAGASGDAEPGAGGSSGMASTAGKAGDACAACEPYEMCSDGGCVVRPECDCEERKVACGPINSALAAAALPDAATCPVNRQCGNCEGSVCTVTDDAEKYGVTVCNTSCMPGPEMNPFYSPQPTCPIDGWPAECSAVYGFCRPTLLADGRACPLPLGGHQGVSWSCGPPL